MSGTKRRFDEQKIQFAFRISLFLKGLFALGQIIGGMVAFFVSKAFLLRTVGVLTEGELTEDPHDLIANYLLHSAQRLSGGTQLFVALYLLSHGGIKLWLIIGLLREKLWYYPIAIVIFAAFIFYQLYRFSFTHSVWWLLITALDLIVIGLTWHEYRYLRHLLRQTI